MELRSAVKRSARRKRLTITVERDRSVVVHALTAMPDEAIARAVEANGTLAAGDGRGLVRLAERCGEDFQPGLLLYAGGDLLPLADKRMLAVPLSELWER